MNLEQRAKTVSMSRFPVMEEDVEFPDWYVLGDLPPRFPVPSIYCLSLISNKVDGLAGCATEQPATIIYGEKQ